MIEAGKKGPSYAELAEEIMKSPPDYFGPAHFSILNVMKKQNIDLDNAVAAAISDIDDEDNDQVGKMQTINRAGDEIEVYINSL